jgi:hypothetical protein
MCSDLNSFSSIIKLGFETLFLLLSARFCSLVSSSRGWFRSPVSFSMGSVLQPLFFLVLGPVSYAKVGPYTLFGNLEPNG